MAGYAEPGSSGGTSEVAAGEDVSVGCGPPLRAEGWSGEEFVAVGEDDGVFLVSGDEDDAHIDGGERAGGNRFYA